MRIFDYKGFTILYEKQIHNGSIIFSTFDFFGNRIKEIYIGYTVSEAKQKFKELLTQSKHETPINQILKDAQ